MVSRAAFTSGATSSRQRRTARSRGDGAPGVRSSHPISPSAVMTSSAWTQDLTGPYLTVRGPDALVETMPPRVAQALLEGSGGSLRPYDAAARFSSACVTLALVVADFEPESTSSRLGIRSRRSRMTPLPTALP